MVKTIYVEHFVAHSSSTPQPSIQLELSQARFTSKKTSRFKTGSLTVVYIIEEPAAINGKHKHSHTTAGYRASSALPLRWYGVGGNDLAVWVAIPASIQNGTFSQIHHIRLTIYTAVLLDLLVLLFQQRVHRCHRRIWHRLLRRLPPASSAAFQRSRRLGDSPLFDDKAQWAKVRRGVKGPR